MGLKMETLDADVESVKASGWVSEEDKFVVFAHNLVLAAIYRPYSSSLTAQFLKKIVEGAVSKEKIKAVVVRNVYVKMVSRAYTPTRSGLGSFLFWCVREGALSLKELIREAEQFRESFTNFETVAFNLFVWLAPELEQEEPEFFACCEEIVGKLSQRQDLYPTVQRFVMDLGKLSAENWEELKKRRESSKALRIFSAIFKRNEIEALLQLFSHPAFNIDQKITQSIFEPALYVSNMPSMIEFAAYCGAIDCFEFLLENGADVTATDNNGLRLRDFAVASGSSEIVEICKQVDPEFEKANHVYAQFYYPGSAISVATLFASVTSGNVDMTMKCIEGGISVNSTDRKERTPLMMAAQYQNQHILQYLLSQPGVDVNKQDVDGLTALQYACQNGSLEVLDLLLAVPGIDVMKAQKYGMTPFHWACQKGFGNLVERLLSDERVDMTALDDELWTGLHFAAHHGHLDVLKLLLGHEKLDVNAQQKDGMTALHFSASNGYQNCITALLGCARVDVMAKDHGGLTALHWAAQNGHGDAIAALVACPKVDVNDKDHDGWTALFWAAQDDHPEAVEALLKSANIDANIAEKDGMIPLHLAAMNGELGVAKVMLACDKVDVNTKDHLGNTPCHLAARNGHPELVGMFVANPRVNINIQQRDLMTPLHFAVSNGNKEAVQVLLASPNCDSTLKDNEGCTAKDFATTFNLTEIEALFP